MMRDGRVPWEKTESGWKRKMNITVSLALGGLVAALVVMAVPEPCKGLVEICVRGVSCVVVRDMVEGRGSMAEGEIVIVDTVKYEGVVIGREYVVEGVLVDKNTNEDILLNGKRVTAETRFVPETRDGTVEIRFTLDAGALKGRDYVIRTSLYVEDAGCRNDEGR